MRHSLLRYGRGAAPVVALSAGGLALGACFATGVEQGAGASLAPDGARPDGRAVAPESDASSTGDVEIESAAGGDAGGDTGADATPVSGDAGAGAAKDVRADAGADGSSDGSSDAGVVVPPVVNGAVALGEYGVHVDGQNQRSTGPAGQTWLMTWDEAS
jgi:hypothetical protein